MILKRAIKTIILTYCIDVIFEKIYRNFQTLNNSSLNIHNFVFIHYTRYLQYIRLKGADFAFHTFMDYLHIHNINLGKQESYDAYVALWDKKENDQYSESYAKNSINDNHGTPGSWRAAEY